MKALIPSGVIAAMTVFLVAQNPGNEQAPAGAAEKIKEALPAEAYAKPEKPRKLLVFAVTNGFRHASIPTGKLALSEMGRTTGAFEAVVSDDLDHFELPKINDYDAICFLNTTQDVFMPHPSQREGLSAEDLKSAEERSERLRANLMNFIKSGRGFIGIHAATDTLYNWPEYGVMMNGYFDGHPWNANTPVSIKVEPGRENHPLVAMFEGQNLEFPEEIYQFREPYDSAAVDMLLRLDTEKTKMDISGVNRTDGDFGVSWARHWGDGRVFYCSLGHNHEMYWHPKVLRHYLAGIQWALGDLQAEITSR
jgi:type 1 glutamine amidotransferase